MKAQGADILSDITEKTSRNLKAIAAGVIAVNIFDIPVDKLRILNVPVPIGVFGYISSALIVYLIVTLLIYWRADYLLWRDGPLMERIREIDINFNAIGNIVEKLDAATPDTGKYVRDQIRNLLSNIGNSQRSLRRTVSSTKLVIFGLHLALPIGLGLIAFAMIFNWSVLLPLLAGD